MDFKQNTPEHNQFIAATKKLFGDRHQLRAIIERRSRRCRALKYSDSQKIPEYLMHSIQKVCKSWGDIVQEIRKSATGLKEASMGTSRTDKTLSRLLITKKTEAFSLHNRQHCSETFYKKMSPFSEKPLMPKLREQVLQLQKHAFSLWNEVMNAPSKRFMKSIMCILTDTLHALSENLFPKQSIHRFLKSIFVDYLIHTNSL